MQLQCMTRCEMDQFRLAFTIVSDRRPWSDVDLGQSSHSTTTILRSKYVKDSDQVFLSSRLLEIGS